MGRKSKAEQRKPEILEHAYEVVKREGLENTTLAKIAESMGVATSLLTHYFDSKEEIICSLADYMVEAYDEFLMLDFSRFESPEKRLSAILDARFWEYSRQIVDDRVWFDVFNLSLRNDHVKEIFTDLYKRDKEAVVAEMHAVFGESNSGKFDELSSALIAIMEGLSYYNTVTRDKQELDAAASVLKEMFTDYCIKQLS